jgi:leucyl aminopeptidase
MLTYYSSLGCRERDGGKSPFVADFMLNDPQRTFLSVAKGSSEPAKFMEMYNLSLSLSTGSSPSPNFSHYNGAAKGVQPLAFVGKGITFDTGGISLKPPAVRDPRTSSRYLGQTLTSNWL